MMNIRIKMLSGQQRLIFILVILLYSKAGWSQTNFYIPKALIIPVHTQKQELHLSLGLGGGYDANISYAITSHLVVFATGTLKNGTVKRMGLFGDKIKIDKDDYAIKGGLGYYVVTSHPIIHVIESYIGIGSYKVDNYRYFPDSPDLEGDVTKAKFWNIFWQFHATHQIQNHEFTAAARLAYSRYTDFQFWHTHPSYNNDKSHFEGLWGLTLDPVLSYSFLFNKFKFNLQTGLSIPLTSVEVEKTHIRTSSGETTTFGDNGITKLSLGTVLGRLSIQHNLIFKRNGKK